ncbi:MAG: isoamylase early set domain-containing protein [Myxococcota bacterium]
MIQKQHLKSRPVCKVTFELPDHYEAERLELCSDVNGWEPIPFKRLKNGKWKLQLDVAPGSQLQFRYRGHRSDSQWWDNDPSADDFVLNTFGSKNCVLVC